MFLSPMADSRVLFLAKYLSIKVPTSVTGFSLWADINCDGPFQSEDQDTPLDYSLAVSPMRVLNIVCLTL